MDAPDGVRPNPTIYDVAKAAGVAPSTVSRAFSRPGRVNSDTAERIRRIASEIGYRTNPLARGLPNGRTALLAVIVADVTNPFFFEIIRGAEKTASEAGYTLLVVDAQESVDAERQALERTLPLVEGLILATSRMSDSSIRVAAKQRPTVVMNRVMTDVPSVLTDNAGGMRSAVVHLVELGHSSLTYVAGPEASWADGMRWRAFREATSELDVKARRLGPYAPTLAGGLAAAQTIAKRSATAVIAYNDLLAIGTIRGLKRQGRAVPDDVSVIGFDNIFGSDFCTPPLTTVAAPLRHLGAFAVQNVLAQLRSSGTVASSEAALLPAKLVERGSTAPRRTAKNRPTAATGGNLVARPS
jgi:LacI family transcriptional regulator, repressor for deo operon, udp, cdd, tsx, nupC, and nupG